MFIPLFLIPIIVGLVTQGMKPLLNRDWYTRLKSDGMKIPRYGGMPSAHTSFAFSMATTVALTEGIYSPLFAMAVAFVIFVLDDALRMRIFLGRHGEALLKLIRRLPEQEQKEFPYLEARLGHKSKEALVGACIGVVLTWILVIFATVS